MASSHDPFTVKQVEIPEATITLRSDSIITVRYKRNVVLDVELQLRMRKIYAELTQGKKMNFVFSADLGFIVTKEARENAELLADSSPIKSYAILVNNIAYRLVANFYYKINKPKVPYKLFSTLEDAVHWIYTLETLEKINPPKQLSL